MYVCVYKADAFDRMFYFFITHTRKLQLLAVILNVLEETVTKVYVDKFESIPPPKVQ